MAIEGAPFKVVSDYQPRGEDVYKRQLLACVLLYFGYQGIARYISENLTFVPLLTDNMTLLAMGRDIMIFGACLGLLGSFLSVVRHLRV